MKMQGGNSQYTDQNAAFTVLFKTLKQTTVNYIRN